MPGVDTRVHTTKLCGDVWTDTADRPFRHHNNINDNDLDTDDNNDSSSSSNTDSHAPTARMISKASKCSL
eukprot:89260-Chlamydomonas_euryale.AAC.4